MIIKQRNPRPRTGLPCKKAETQALHERIIKLVTEGKTNKEIALQVERCEKTVKNIMEVLFSEFDVQSRTQLAVAVVRLEMSDGNA